MRTIKAYVVIFRGLRGRHDAYTYMRKRWAESLVRRLRRTGHKVVIKTVTVKL